MAKIIGLDIGSFSIKAASLTKKGTGYRLEALGIVLNPASTRPGDDDASFNSVCDAVKSLINSQKLGGSRAVLALSDSQVYTRVVEMPTLSDAELASAIYFEAEQYIPVPIDQVNIDYEVLSRPQKGSATDKMQVFLVAAPKKVVDRVSMVGQKCNLNVIGLETETLSVIRSMMPIEENPETTMIVHMGASNTSMCVISLGSPVVTHTIETAGVTLTRSISNELNIDYAQAEEYKRSFGLNANQLEGKVANILQPIIDRILAEARKTQQYYNNSNQQSPIRRAVLSGGSALLPGLLQYSASLLGIEVVLGNAFSNVQASVNTAIPGDGVSFSTVIGLAMREL
jgi:type IV pilus assembly protein PilM